MSQPKLAPLAEADWTDEQREVLERIFSGGGRARNIFTTLVRRPKLLRRWAAFGGTLLARGELPGRDREVLILRTARNCAAEYEWGQHELAARALGLGSGELAAITGDASALDPPDRLLVRAADELHADARLSDATWAELATRYSEGQLIELLFLVGQYHLVSFALNSIGVEREPGVPGLPPRP
ncbi:MAG TPA: carboxymuconolactone decarboxylase family protein [Acidimicrobiales bacterium]|jgi:alkylhydroperoxidase family enzyme